MNSAISDCELLEQDLYMGLMVRSKKGRYIGMRYIIAGKYLVLYKVDRDRVMTSSIIDIRTKGAAGFLDKEIRPYRAYK